MTEQTSKKAFQQTLQPTTQTVEYEFAGFWRRFAAILLDGLFLMIVSAILVGLFFGGYDYNHQLVNYQAWDIFLNLILPIGYAVIMWKVYGATLGKMGMSCRVVNAKTGEKIGFGRGLLRYIGYFISSFVFGLGFIWAAFDAKKRGWHDLIAGTVVIKLQTEKAHFPNPSASANKD